MLREDFEVSKGETLIIDPCYILNLPEVGECLVCDTRKSLHAGDGDYAVIVDNFEICELGCDSGSVAVYKVIENCTIHSSAGFSGWCVLGAEQRNGELKLEYIEGVGEDDE